MLVATAGAGLLVMVSIHELQAQASTQIVTPTQKTGAELAASQYAGRTVNNTDLADAIRRSGLTHEALRARLQAAGYDPGLADPFFATASAGTTQPVSALEGTGAVALPNAAVVGALQALGIVSPTDASFARDPASPAQGTAESDGAARTPSPVAARPSTASGAAGVFGRDMFTGAATAFDPVAAGPVDPSFRLGIGDQLQFILTGDVEVGYQLDVRRDGTVFVPQLGLVNVGGLTLDAARAVLRSRAGSSYSGIHTGSTRLDVSLSRIRTNSVFVIGEVEQPGAKLVSALATAFHAMARAGGPTARGSFRKIEIRRAGQTIKHLDLYKYLIDGDASDDIRMEQGDVIFAPLAERKIAITGAVRRPGTFELRGDEGFDALLRFAGGMLATASLDRIQIDRVLPAAQRRPGVERVLIDVRLNGSSDVLKAIPLQDEDAVTVFFVGDVRRNAVVVRGAVVQPGTYEHVSGMTLGDLIERAQGLLPWALPDRIKVLRPIASTGRREQISLNYDTGAGASFELREFDEIVILDARKPVGSLLVEGSVWNPGKLGHADNQTLRDVIDAAGGLRPEAAVIHVSRRRTSQGYNDTTSVVARFDVDTSGVWESAARRFRMEHDDHVFVFASPGSRAQRFVIVHGLFAYPGVYALTEGTDRIADIVQRAGGLLPSAYAGSFRLTRDSLPVATDLSRAMANDVRHNLLLKGGDRLFVGGDPGTVLITGAVAQQTLLRYQKGLSVRDYLNLAGGPRAGADLSRVTVEDLSGRIGRSRRIMLLFRSEPPVGAGARIHVPAKTEGPKTLQGVLAGTLQYATAVASLAVALAAITR